VVIDQVFSPRKIVRKSIYIRGIRADLDAAVDATRRLQIKHGFCKMCPACLRVLTVGMFADYQSLVCRRCELDPNVIASRYEPVSFLP
jgi:hypothetical protein